MIQNTKDDKLFDDGTFSMYRLGDPLLGDYSSEDILKPMIKELESNKEELTKLYNNPVIVSRCIQLLSAIDAFSEIRSPDMRNYILFNYKLVLKELISENKLSDTLTLSDSAYGWMLKCAENPAKVPSNHMAYIEAYIERILTEAVTISIGKDVRFLWIFLFIYMVGGADIRIPTKFSSMKYANQLYLLRSAGNSSIFRKYHGNMKSIVRILGVEIAEKLHLDHTLRVVSLYSSLAYIFYATMCKYFVNSNELLITLNDFGIQDRTNTELLEPLFEHVTLLKRRADVQMVAYCDAIKAKSDLALTLSSKFDKRGSAVIGYNLNVKKHKLTWLERVALFQGHIRDKLGL